MGKDLGRGKNDSRSMGYNINLGIFKNIRYLIILPFLLYSCGSKPDGNITLSELTPKLDPEYSDITIPPNIAPLNFIIKEKGTAYFARFSSVSGTEIELTSGNGKIQIPERTWRKMLQNSTGKNIKIDIYSRDDEGKWLKFKTITNKVASEPIDS